MEEEVQGSQVKTCFGPQGCPNRAVVCPELPEQVRECLAARDLKSFLKKIVQGPLKIHHEFRVTLADCPNACSRPQIADVGLIGACQPLVTGEICSGCGACAETCLEGAISFADNTPVIDADKCLSCGKCLDFCPTGTLRAGKSGYRIMLGGKLGRHPRLATELSGIFEKNEIPKIIDRCLDYYRSHCVGGERLGEIMEKDSVENAIRKILS